VTIRFCCARASPEDGVATDPNSYAAPLTLKESEFGPVCPQRHLRRSKAEYGTTRRYPSSERPMKLGAHTCCDIAAEILSNSDACRISAQSTSSVVNQRNGDSNSCYPARANIESPLLIMLGVRLQYRNSRLATKINATTPISTEAFQPS
jgi:hypothetical protein